MTVEHFIYLGLGILVGVAVAVLGLSLCVMSAKDLQ
jgi:hypothetical protein